MIHAIILAAGSSARFGGNKIFAHLWGVPVLEHVLNLCESSARIKTVYVAHHKNDKKRVETLCKKVLTKPWRVVEGGATRFESSLKATKFVHKEHSLTKKDLLVFLNGANPLATEDEIERCIKASTKDVAAAAVGRPVSSSLKKVSKKTGPRTYAVAEDVSRMNVFEMETPQVVNAYTFHDVVQGIDLLGKTSDIFTDELAVVGFSKKKTAVVLANKYNKKITTSADLAMLNGLVTAVGVGEDSHSLVASQKPLMLGGLRIPSPFAFEADSDGDVVLHAIANALSSALGGGSLGTFASPMCEDGITDSKEYVKVVLKKAKKSSLHVFHLSLSIEGVHPKIDAIAPEMRASLSDLFLLPPERIGITATTGKNHTAYGKGKAVKCTAFILLRHA